MALNRADYIHCLNSLGVDCQSCWWDSDGVHVTWGFKSLLKAYSLSHLSAVTPKRHVDLHVYK